MLRLAIAISCVIGSANARAEEPGFELVRSEIRDARKRARGRVSLTIVPRAGHRLLADAPILVRPSGEGVDLERSLLHREDAVDPAAEVPRFEIAFTPSRLDPRHLSAECTFYLCDAKRCRPVVAKTQWDF